MESDRDPLRKIPTKHAPEVKADIGSALRSARTRKGATLEAVGQHTRIPKKFLDALENNRFEEFPALAYLRGFLKSYCDYLEIEFEPLWKQIVPDAAPPAQQQPTGRAATPVPAPKAATEPKHAPEPPAKTPVPSAKPAPAPASKAPAHADGHPPHAALPAEEPMSAGAPSPVAAAGAIIAAVAVAVLIGVWLFMPRSQKPLEPIEPPPQPPAALQPLKPVVQPDLSIVFRRDMWVSISIDGVEKFQGRVPQGSKQDWKAKRTITLRASDPQALKLTLNGQPYALPAPDAEGTFRIEAP